MAKNTASNFKTFIVKAVNKTPLTTAELYRLAQSRRLSLTRSMDRDPNRPNQYEWQHKLRRDQNSLANAGVIQRTSGGYWVPTSSSAVQDFLTA